MQGTILILRGSTTPIYATYTLDSMDSQRKFSHDSSLVSVQTKISQLIQPTGFIAPSNPLAGHSPNISLEFVVEILYPEGMGPDLTQPLEVFRVLARNAVNTAFTLSLA